MPGITMVDTSVFGALNRANSAPTIAKDLQELAAQGETIMVGDSAHQEILKTPDQALKNAQLRQIEDFKMKIQDRLTVAEEADTIGERFADATVKDGKLNMQRGALQIKDLRIAADVKTQMGRTPNQKVKLFTVERMVNNKAAITKTYGIEFSPKSRVVTGMGDRIPYNPESLGVKPATPKPAPVEEVPPPVVPEVPTGPPVSRTGKFMKARVGAMKGALKALLSAEALAMMGTDLAAKVFLAYADKTAAEAAIKRIQVFFIKEGFAKGFAAGILGWSETEVASNALNWVTHARVRGMGDAAGLLKLDLILKLAETYENYAVAVGWNYAYYEPNEWKGRMRGQGIEYLKARGYGDWGNNPQVLFEYPFLAKLAWALRAQSDAIVGPAIRFGKKK